MKKANGLGWQRITIRQANGEGTFINQKTKKMKIDLDHYQGAMIAQEELNILQEQSIVNLIALLKPEFHQDGNMYCFTYPSREGLPNDCIQGFGETAFKAACNFNENFYNQTAS